MSSIENILYVIGLAEQTRGLAMQLCFTNSRIIAATIIDARRGTQVSNDIKSGSAAKVGAANVVAGAVGAGVVGAANMYKGSKTLRNMAESLSPKLKGKTPDELLADNSNNFEILYQDITQITLERGSFWSPSKVIISAKQKTYSFRISLNNGTFSAKPDDKLFGECSNSLKEIFKEKFTVK